MTERRDGAALENISGVRGWGTMRPDSRPPSVIFEFASVTETVSWYSLVSTLVLPHFLSTPKRLYLVSLC